MEIVIRLYKINGYNIVLNKNKKVSVLYVVK